MKKPRESSVDGFVVGAISGFMIGFGAPLGGAGFNCLLGGALAILLGLIATTRLGIRFPLSIGTGLAMAFGGSVFFCNNLLARMSGVAAGRLPPFGGEWALNLVAAVLAAAAILAATVAAYFIKLFFVKTYLRLHQFLSAKL